MDTAVAKSSPISRFTCIGCGEPLPVDAIGDFKCVCGEAYVAAPGYLKTAFDAKLFANFRKDFLLNKVLNNNGYIGYQFLKEGSLSLPDRPWVVHFREFLERNIFGQKILDVGCGVMDMPGYLKFDNAVGLELIGLDPIDDNSFNGLQLVAVSEYIPLPDGSVDTAVFATSLDHVCNIQRSLMEVRRILHPEGRVVVWMGDRSTPLLLRIKNWFLRRYGSWKQGYNLDHYEIYPNWTVMGIPHGAVDPYHSYLETPSKIIREFRRQGFKLVNQTRHSKMEVFLSFSRGA